MYKKVIGKMKEKFGEVIIHEFAGWKSKMYSIKKIDGQRSNTVKGVNIAKKHKKSQKAAFFILDVSCAQKT